MQGDLAVTGDAEADRLVNTDSFALLVAMLLDQQVPMERAFRAPLELRRRLGGKLDPNAIASMDPSRFASLFSQPPALHRFPGAMAKRVQAMSHAIVDGYCGDAARLWTEAADGADLHRRLLALPGFGEEKSRIFVALLAKRFGLRLAGWEQAAGPFADAKPRSAADVGSRADFEAVRGWKKQQRVQGLGKAD